MSVIAFGVTIFDMATQGFDAHIGSLRISTRDPFRPFLIGVVAGSLAIWLRDGLPSTIPIWNRIPYWSQWLAAVVAGLSVVTAIHLGIFAVGGADSYGYVSEAALWASGQLVIPEPLATMAPSLGSSVAPLGYQLAVTPGYIVPIYSPGFPMLMAAALKVGGQSAVYFVVPLLGGLAVWLTFVLGNSVAGPRTGLLAAVLLATSPIFLSSTLGPMSDVPAATWWLAALVLATAASPGNAYFAGCASAAAVLTRPNLVPLALAVALLTLGTRPQFRRAAFFALGVVPGCLAVAAINRHLYGSAVVSGYGPVTSLFSWRWFGTNLRQYSSWLFDTHSIFIFLGLSAPLFLGSGSRVRTFSDDETCDRPTTLILIAFSGLVAASYLFYRPFDSWHYLRFLLPAMPIWLMMTSVVITRLVGTLPVRSRGAALFAVCGLVAGVWVQRADQLQVFDAQASEQRYITIGEYIDRQLPPKAVVLTVIQSGSVRLYGHRTTIRWDQLKPEQFDEAIHVLEVNGYVPYILLEEWEQPAFAAHYSSSTTFGQLDWPAALSYDGPVRSRIYAADDRARYLGGQSIVTKQIPVSSGMRLP